MPETLHATHLLKLLDKMYTYEMDPTRTEGATERTRDAGRTDRRTDGRTDGRSETNTPPPPKKKKKKTSLCGGGGGGGYNKEWIYLYIPGKFVLRKCVFQKEILIYAKCRELIERCCMKFIQTCQSFFPVFFCFFFPNNFRFTSYKYVTFEYPKIHRPTYLIWFLLMISRQTNHKFEYGMVS